MRCSTRDRTQCTPTDSAAFFYFIYLGLSPDLASAPDLTVCGKNPSSLQPTSDELFLPQRDERASEESHENGGVIYLPPPHMVRDGCSGG